MDIQIMEHNEATMKIIIKCAQINNEILRLKTHIELFDNKLTAKKLLFKYFYCSKVFINSSRGMPMFLIEASTSAAIGLFGYLSKK